MEKDRIEFLMKLAEVAWRDYSERRSIEWKVNFALWTSLGAFSGFVFQQKVAVESLYALAASIIIICVVAVYIFVWKAEIQRRNRLDLDAAQKYWIECDKEIGIDSPDVRTRHGSASRWRKTHLSQAIITVLLGLLCILAIWTPKQGYMERVLLTAHGRCET